MKITVRALSLIAVLVLVLASVDSVGAKPSGTVSVQILALNDFHGNLLPPAGSSGRVGTIDAGGVEYLATHINNLRATKPNTVVVSAGDMYTAGKTEQGEINWIWPGDQLEPTVRWMLQRTAWDGGVSYPRTGETYPGFNMCKLCPLLVWTKPKE